MALTSGGSVNPTPSAANGAAQSVETPGVTRAGRLGNISEVAATGQGVPGSGAPSEAFMDGNTLPRLDSENRPDVRPAGQINGGESGFPGLANENYSDLPGNPNGVERTNVGAAPIVNRQASVKGGQAGGPVDASTSEAYDHGSSAGFPFDLPPARKL